MKQIITLLVAAGMTLAAFSQTPSTVGVALQPRTSRVVGTGTNLFTANSDRAVATLETVARLSTITNAVHGSVVDVRGYDAEFDWPVPLRYTLNTNSVAATNRFVIANAAGIGRWVHDWNGDVLAFGVVANSLDADTANKAALDRATLYAGQIGAELQLPAGSVYSSGPIDCLGTVHTVKGRGTIGDPNETILIITTQNTSAITNLPTGGKVTDMHIRSKFYAWGKTATAGYAIHGENSSAAQEISRVYIQGFYAGIRLSTFDSLIQNCDVIAKRPILISGGGTQNVLSRVAARGNLFVTGLTNDTSIQCASYTGGTTNFTVDDASNLSVGDYIRVRDSTEYSNTITYRFFPRKIMAISGTSVTINYPWALSFTNGRFEFALGKGFSAFEANTENVMVGCNAEWGSWDHIYTPNSGPTASSTIAGLHVEGWTVDGGTGVNSYVLNGLNTSISASVIDMANVTVFDSAGVALAEGGTRGYIDILHLRDFDQYQAIPYFYAGAWNLTKTYSGGLVVNDINNAGVDVLQRTVDGTQWRNTVSDFKFGEGGEMVRVDGTGIGNAIWYGFSDTPTGGNFVQGDKVITANEVLRVLSTGSFQTAAGSNRIFNGSSVLLVDQDARGVLGRRTPVSCLVTNGTNVSTVILGVVKEQLRNSPDTNVLTAAASIGDRMIKVADASGIQQGDPGVIIEGSTYNDVIVSRVASPWIFVSRPLTNAFTTSATFYTGVQLYSAVTNDVAWQPVMFTVPTFLKELDYIGQQRVGGSNVLAGLTVVGGWNGAAGMAWERSGVGTNEMTFSGEQIRFRDKSDSRYLASWLKSGTTLYHGIGNSSGSSTPLTGIIQTEAGSGANVAGGSLTIRAGQGTGNAASSALTFAASIPGSSGATAQTYGTGLRIQFPPTPDSVISNSPLQSLRYDGTNWVTMSMTWTNEGGIWRQYWR